MQSDSCWQKKVPELAGPGPETPQPLGGGTPGGFRGHHVVQRVLGVRHGPVQLFHSNTSVDVLGVAVSAPAIFAPVLATLSSRSVSAFLELLK